MVLFVSSFVLALDSVDYVAPSPYQNSSGVITLNATIDDGDGVVNNVTFEFVNSTGDSYYNETVFNVTATTFTNETFDTSVLADGVYNLTIHASNGTDDVSNVSVVGVTIDNTAPSVDGFYNVVNWGNYSGTEIINVSVSDVTSEISSMYLNFTNSSGVQNGFIAATCVGAYCTYSADVAAFTAAYGDGVYNMTVYVNDTLNNLNSSEVITITMDSTAPSASLSKSSSTSSSITVTTTCSDATSGLSGCVVSCASGTVSGSTVSGLSCGSSYSITVTATDYAGNTATASETMTTDSCSGGSNGGSTSSSSWTNTFVEDDKELGEKGEVSKSLGSKHRVRLKVGGETHYVGVTSLNSNSATVEVASTPQTATLNVGDEKKFDVDGDNFYDVMVRLVSISGSKANVVISSVSGEVAIISDGGDSLEDGDVVGSSPEGSGVPAEGRGIWIWVLLGVLVVGGVVYFVVMNSKRK
jgi:hypothetical protein